MPELNFQSWLDRVGQSFFDDDYATYRAAVRLPMMVITHGANMVIDTEDALRKGFDGWRDMLRAQGVTDMVRTAHEVVFLNDRMIDGRYSTHILRNAMPVVPPFDSSMTLTLEDDAWKAVSVASGMSNVRWPIDVPRVTDAPRAPQNPTRKES